MSKDKSGGGKLAIGAAIGAVAGVITGLLFAPKSGKETRKDISENAVKVKNKVVDEAKNAEVELKKIVDKVEKEARNRGKSLSKTADAAVKKANEVKVDLIAKAKEIGQDSSSEDKLKEATKRAIQAKKDLEKLL